ncbi:MAG: tRNA lysidine(34) synthetase TilS [Porphyromonas sp.]|nr:tRNA lysidine(34) synthetase TilS [Porphyromonas sp.]
MLEGVVDRIREQLPAGHPVVVGVSGGADSMTLLHLMRRTGLPLIVAHVNFQLRGTESDRDEAFVLEQEPRAVVRRFQTEQYAQERGLSIEMAARELRYGFFRELAKEHGASAIAVGHNANDQVETLLLNLTRGTGGSGLCGMEYFGNGILRPLLETTREEIIKYLDHYQLPHIEDQTNSQTIYQRNALRHQVVPALQQLNPSFITSTLRSMEIFRQEQEIVEERVRAFREERWEEDKQRLSLKGIYEDPHADLLLFRLLQPLGYTSQQVEDILYDTTRSGKVFPTPTDGRALELFREYLYLLAPLPPLTPQRISTLGSYPLGRLGNLVLNKNGGTLRIPRALLDGGLELRQANKEDYFIPFGMKRGRKLLFDYLKEQGIPSSYRPHCPVLKVGDEVVAIPALEVSERARVTGSDDPVYLTLTQGDHPLAHLL